MSSGPGRHSVLHASAGAELGPGSEQLLGRRCGKREVLWGLGEACLGGEGGVARAGAGGPAPRLCSLQ